MSPTRDNPGALRLLHINSAPKWTGEAAHSVDLAVGMRERGHQVLWIGSLGTPVIDRAREAGVDVATLRLRSSFGWWREASDFVALRRIVREFRPDIVHCHRGKDHLLAVLALRWLGGPGFSVPLVRTRHVVMPVGQGFGNRYLYGQATDFLLAVSRATARSLDALWPGGLQGVEEDWRFFVEGPLHRPAMSWNIPPRRAAVVLSAANLNRFAPSRRDLAWRHESWGIPPEALVVGLVGRIQRIKGQQVFLQAAELLANRWSDVHFVCAGRGSEDRLRMLSEAGRAGALGKRWHVVGEMDDVARAIASLDAGVVASVGSEGSSRIMYEYLASGLPAVASRVGGIPDMAAAFPGADITLVEPDNPAELAEAIATAVEKVRQGRPQQCPDEVRAILGQERWFSNMEAIYRGIAAAHRARTDQPAAAAVS